MPPLTKSEASPRPATLIPATVLLAELQGLERLGLDRAAIEREVLAVIGAWPADPDGLIPVAGYERMWQVAMDRFGSNDLPTALGLAIPFGAFGTIDYLAASADTLAGSIASLELHLSVMTRDTRLQHDAGEAAHSRVSIAVNGPLGIVAEEFTLAALVGRFAILTDPPVKPLWVGLRTPARPPAEAGNNGREQRLGVPVRYGQPVTSMTLHSAQLRQRMCRADPYLHATLVSLARQLNVDAQPASDLEQAIRARLRDALGHGRAQPRSVAHLLGLSERTLQRRLAELGRSFRTIVEDFRREEATHLLANARLALTDVAARLGYAEQTSFTRAFRRWTGRTPGDWRRDNAVTR